MYKPCSGRPGGRPNSCQLPSVAIPVYAFGLLHGRRCLSLTYMARAVAAIRNRMREHALFWHYYNLRADRCCCADVNLQLEGEGEGQQDEDLASGTAVMMSAFATAGGGVGVAYANTAFRNLGLMEFELADLEGVVVQVDVEFSDFQLLCVVNRTISHKFVPSTETELSCHQGSKKIPVTAVSPARFCLSDILFAECSCCIENCLGPTRR